MASDTYYVPLRVIRPRCTHPVLGHEVKIECDPAVGLLFVYCSMKDLRSDYPDADVLEVVRARHRPAGRGDDGTD
jgi:hypothetical protein